jgi:flagellin
MALVIQTNVGSLLAQKNLNKTQEALTRSFNKLSSGFRINTAADDAAGLAISESMGMQIRSFTVAERNANDAISMAQTAEGALGEAAGILGRMRELAMQGANGDKTATDRAYIDAEFQQLKAEITRIQSSTKYNGATLLMATSSQIKFQVGLSNQATDKITITFGLLTLTALLAATTEVSGPGATSSLNALGRIDTALTTISTQRAKYGAAMNRLSNTTSNIQTVRTNLSAARSRIRDVDVAEETSTLSRNQVLSQAGAAVLAQANASPQLAMMLLQ